MDREIWIEPYNDNWTKEYNEIKNIILNILENQVVDIQHIGSTSIKGLSAKPTIDVLVIVREINRIDEYNSAMLNSFLIPTGEGGIKGRRYFYKTSKNNKNIETHHIHIYQKGNPKYQEEILFRDYLKENSNAMREYELLKKKLAKKYRHSPADYTNAKSDFISKTVDKAKTLLSKD